MSLVMMAAVWLTGVLLGMWKPIPTLVKVAPVAVALATLAALLAAVEMGRLLMRPPAGFGAAARPAELARLPGSKGSGRGEDGADGRDSVLCDERLRHPLVPLVGVRRHDRAKETASARP
jgi:hypothetical protein